MQQNSLLYYVVTLLRWALYPLALLYGTIVWLRNRLYDAQFFSSVKFSVPVISVGNLSTGGTGKTPHIEYLIELFQYRYQAATMSRGYKRFSKGFVLAGPGINALKIGDEPMQFYMKYPEAVVCVAEERLTGIPTLLQRRPDIDVILLDDAYQHRSVRPGLNILITDFSRPYYSDYILPFGNLREGRSAYKRADVIIVSKCSPDLSVAQATEIKNKIKPLPHQQVFFTAIRYFQPYELLSRAEFDIKGKSAIIVAGIARPEPFIGFVRQYAANVHTLTYADHHYFVTADLDEIKTVFNNWNVADKIIVTTEKDAARLILHQEKLATWGIAIVVVPVKVQVLFADDLSLNNTINNYVEQTIRENNEAMDALAGDNY